MQKSDKICWREAFGYAGAFIACLTGSGFATGQEILQYFVAYGRKGFLVSVTMAVLFAGIGICFIRGGKRENFSNNSEIFHYYCGPYIGAFYRVFSPLFIFMSYVVMVAGAGSTLQQQYHVSEKIGCVCMMAAVCITAQSGFHSIIKIIQKIGPVIAGLAVLLGGISFFSSPEELLKNMADIASGTIQMNQVGNNWFSSTCSYVGFCVLWLAGVLTAIGKNAFSGATGIWGVSMGSVGFTFSCTAMMVGLLAVLPQVKDAEIPALILAVRVAPGLAYLLSISIFIGIYSAAVPLLWQASSTFAKEGSKNYRVATVILAVLGAGIALLFPFSTLVNAIYGVSGYIGIVFAIFVVKKELGIFLAEKNSSM